MACAPRQVHRRGRRLPRDLGPGRDPPAERPLRREARPPAGRRDRRPAGARRARRRLPAGGRPRRRCSRTSRTSTCRWRPCPAQMRHLVDRADPDRARRAHGHLPDRPERPRGAGGRREPPHEHGTIHSGVGYSRAARSSRADDDLRARRRDPERGRAGGDAGRRGRARRRATRCSRSPRCSAPASPRRCSARPSLPDDLPFVTGSIGLLGTRPSWELMNGCDTLLMVGSSFPYSEFLPEEGQARGVQIDIDAPDDRHPLPDGGQPRRRRARDAARAAPAARAQGGPLAGSEQIEASVERLVGADGARARMDDADPINPQRVFWELSPRLPDRCILTADSGSAANWYARDLKLRSGMMASLSGTLATMGPGVPVRDRREVRPPRPAGDRARRRRRDADERHQRADHGRQVLAALERPAARRARAQQPRPQPGDVGAARDGGRPEVTRPRRTLPDFPYARYAELIGLRGIRVDDPDAGRRGLGRGARGRPAGRARGDRRPGGAAAAAAHHASSRPSTSPRPRSTATRERAAMIRSRSGRCSTRSLPGGDAPRSSARDASRVERRRRLGVHDPDRRARVRRDARVGLDDDRGRRGRRPAASAASATPTRPPRRRAHRRRRCSPPCVERRERARHRRRAGRRWRARSATWAGRASPRWRSPRSTSRSGT